MCTMELWHTRAWGKNGNASRERTCAMRSSMFAATAGVETADSLEQLEERKEQKERA